MTLFSLIIYKCNRFLPGIKPQFYKALSEFPAAIFPEMAPREHWISPAFNPSHFMALLLLPYRFFSLSPTINPGTVTVQLKRHHKTVTKLELFQSDSGAVHKSYKDSLKCRPRESAEMGPREHQIGIEILNYQITVLCHPKYSSCATTVSIPLE